MSSLTALKDFYKANPVDLSFLTHCSWRQFRFVLPSGRFWKLPRQIKDNKTFNTWLVRRSPIDVYYSTSCWLAPVNVGARSDLVSENLFLYSDLVFDIDGENSEIKNIEKARKESIKLLKFLDEHKISIKYLAFSGSKGFHIVCEDPFKNTLKCPLEREEKNRRNSRQISLNVFDSGIKTDSRVTIDTRRILRVPGTINSKSGYCCRIINREDLLQNPAKEIIKNTKSINISALVIPRGDDQEFTFLRKILGLYRFRARSNPPLYYYASFLSNKVVSTKLFVPIIEFKKINESKIILKLISIMKTYKLSDAFLFKGEYYFTILPFALQKRRIEKILKLANSLNLTSFRKYHQTFTRISAKVDMKMKRFSEKPVYLRHISVDLPEKPVSASHIQFLIEVGADINKFHSSIGSEQYIIRHALIEC